MKLLKQLQQPKQAKRVLARGLAQSASPAHLAKALLSRALDSADCLGCLDVSIVSTVQAASTVSTALTVEPV